MKIIQIAAAAVPETNSHYCSDSLYALCENGRVAYIDFQEEHKWQVVDEVPDDLFDK